MKNQLTKLFYTLSLLLISIGIGHGQLYINEFMASNGSSITDESGDNEDWIEIYNEGTSDVDLAGYYMSDDPSEPTLWQIESGNPALTTVPAGGFLILWADKDTDDGSNHLDFKLGASGEDILLLAPDGVTIIDQISFLQQVEDVSFGRIGDGANDFDFFATPTPGASNDTPPGAPQVANPVASISGGFHSGTLNVELSTSTPDAVIYYTTDGSRPDENDMEYDAPLLISDHTPLRFRAFLAPLIPSEIKTETYLINVNHSFPVVAYTADPEEMFDPATGMYSNFEEDIEINVNAEMYEPDGSLAFNQRFESEINGTGSASADQKSLALKAKSSLGSATIDYPVFPISEQDEYRSLILRNSGQDNNITMFRDVMASSLVLDISDVNTDKPQISTPEIFGQNYRPGITYINGEYWGIMNIRERTDKRYIRARFGLDDDEIDFLENDSEVREGDLEAWEELTDFLENNDLDNQGNFQFVDDRIDLSHYIDYLAFNIYIDNSDWPGNNIRRYRERVADAQWRWLTYDLDFSFGLFVQGQAWNSGFNDANSLERLLSLNGFGWPNPDYATLLFRKLMENPNFRTRFVNRTADQLNLLFNDDRVINRIDEFQAIYSPEIEQHIDRWTGFLAWEDKIQIMRNFASGRADNVRDHFISEIDDIDGLADVTVNLNSAENGTVEWNTVSVHDQNAPFSGIYFTGVDIPVNAFPNRGYILESWSGDLSGNNPSEVINLSSDVSITANFTLGSASEADIVINEINYNSPDDLDSDDWVELYNPNNFSVDISGWYFEDESGRFFGLPANTLIPAGAYLVLAETADKFSAVYPQVSNFIGDFGRDPQGFGLSGGGEMITLKNANGTLIDMVEYDDKSPWPEAADGDGPTLQLIAPDLDNTLASSWEAIPATPGALNGSSSGQSQVINFAAIPDQLTTNSPFQISASATSGLPVSFTIISGPATISGNTISLTGVPGTVSVQASQAGNANWNPAPNVIRTFNVTTPPIVGGDYCDAQGDQPWLEWIAGVNINTLNNESGKSQYSDFTNLSTQLNTGVSYNINLTAGFSWTTYPEYFKVWIDYNQNGIFEEPAELAFSGILSGIPNGTSTGVLSGTINIPANAVAGNTRMRVAMQRETAPPACGSFLIGEVEDYSIIIGDGGGGPTQITLQNCPESFTIITPPGEDGTFVSWDVPEGSTTCPSGGLEIEQIGGAPNGSFFNEGTYQIVYAASDACNNGESCVFSFTVVAGGISNDYCESSSDFPWHEWIAGVQLNTINNNSAKSVYSDFTNINTSLDAGSDYPLTLTTAYSWFTYDEYWNVWIDYNQNGIFEEPAELAYSGVLNAPPNGTESATLNGSISVPLSAFSGTTRMRVSMKRAAAANPCETLPFGEVEDYTINIVNSINAGGQSGPGSADSMFKIFPNPSSSEVNLILKEEREVKLIEIFEVTGQRIKFFEVIPGQRFYSMNVRQWREGIYFVQIQLENGQRLSQRLSVHGNY